MPYVRFGAGLAPTSDEAVTRSDDQSGVAIVDAVPQGYEEIDAATYATDKATILAFNTALAEQKAAEEAQVPPDPDEELKRALEAARNGSLSDLIDVLQGAQGLAAAKGRLAGGGG